VTTGEGRGVLPAIKVMKYQVEDILSGGKTLEPRPRGEAWIARIQTARRAQLTWGPRMGAPTVFAIAQITSVEIRGFETATQADVDRVGSQWKGRPVADFVAEYTAWFAKDLNKGHRVAWISFDVVEDLT
jgi:hypothetical protein